MVARLQYLRFCLFEICVSVVFVIRSLYSTVSLTLVKVKKRFIRIIIIANDIGFICAGVSNVAVMKETPNMIITKSELSVTNRLTFI